MFTAKYDVDLIVDGSKNIWCFDTPGVLKARWEGIPFLTKNRIEWRGLIFHVQINVYPILYGWTRVISFIYQDQQYNCSLTKWKYLGGGHGDSPPKIASQDHQLKIEMGSNFISFTDSPLFAQKGLDRENTVFQVSDSLKQFAPRTPNDTKTRFHFPKIKRRDLKFAIAGLVVFLIITNPSLKDFRDFEGLYPYETKFIGLKRSHNFILFSVFEKRDRSEGELRSSSYLGVAGNFFKRDD